MPMLFNRRVRRPDWSRIYGVEMPKRASELIAVTRETLRLSQSAIQKSNEQDYSHNFGAAEREIDEALRV